MTRLFFSLRAKMAASLIFVVMADILFYAEPDGWGYGLFAFALLALVTLSQPQALKTIAGKAIAFLCATLAVDMVAEPGILNVSSYCLGVLSLLVLQKRPQLASAPLWLKDICSFLSHTLKIWNHELFQVNAILRKRRWGSRLAAARRIGHVALPVVLCLVFCWLFAEANPVLMQALARFDWSRVIYLLSAYRWGFWLACGAVVWAMLRPRFPLAKPGKFKADVNLDAFVNRRSITVSLLIFNIIFALQNISDLVFLWREEPLPNRMTYAEYAHAGAYPLIATALLAGAYVLITFGNGEGKYQSPFGRQLVYAWIAQNIFLVISAIDRTLHYVEAYSLTYLRVAALIWMGLVALGLATLVVRIAWNRSNLWLINANSLALAAVVYACCFINFAGFVADYNVRHCREMTGSGPSLDVPYLQSLGWQAAPSLHWLENNIKSGQAKQRPVLQRNLAWAPIPAGIAADHLDGELTETVNSHWQGWTLLRQLRLRDIATKTQP